MSYLTEAQIKTKLDNIYAAIDKAVDAASYSIGGRSKSNQRIKELQDMAEYWENRLAAVQGTRSVNRASFKRPR